MPLDDILSALPPSGSKPPEKADKPAPPPPPKPPEPRNFFPPEPVDDASSAGSGLPIGIKLLVLLAVLLGGGWAAAKFGFGIDPIKMLLNRPPTLEEVLANTSQITSATVKMSLSATTTEPRLPSTPEISFEKPEDDVEVTEEDSGISITSMVAAGKPAGFSKDMSLNTGLNWTWSVDGQDVDESAGSFDLTYMTPGEPEIGIDVEWRYVDSYLYLRAEKLPSLGFITLEPLTGPWISIKGGVVDLTKELSGGMSGSGSVYEPEDGVTVDEGDFFRTIRFEGGVRRDIDLSRTGDTSSEEREATAPMRELTVILQKASDFGAFKAADFELKETGIYEVNLDVEPAPFRMALQEAIEQRNQLLPEVEKFYLLTDGFREYLADDWSRDAFEKMVGATRYTALVSAETETLVGFSSVTEFVPPSEEAPDMGDRMVRVTMSMSLENVNQPVSVEAPKESVTVGELLSDVFGGMFGEGEPVVDFGVTKNVEQEENVEGIRGALEAYKESYGEYPPTLDKLVGFEYEKVSKTYKFDKETREPVEIDILDVVTVKLVPLDAYTDLPYNYKVVGDSYVLRYELRDVVRSYYGNSIHSVEGTNTATPETMSLETELQVEAWNNLGGSNADPDNDGLVNSKEYSKGTNPTNPDSDGDGYSDGDEVNGGYDPLENGKTGQKVGVFEMRVQ